MADRQARFHIGGREYPMPGDDLTMDEAIVIFDYSGLTLEQIEGNSGNPKVIKAMMHIAYLRGNPDTPEDEIRCLVGSAVLLDALSELMEADAGPPEQTTQATESSERNSDSSSNGSGNGSTVASAAPDDEQTPTGIRSLPSSTSDVKTSAA